MTPITAGKKDRVPDFLLQFLPIAGPSLGMGCFSNVQEAHVLRGALYHRHDLRCPYTALLPDCREYHAAAEG